MTWKLSSRNTPLSSWTNAITCQPLHSNIVLRKHVSVTSWGLRLHPTDVTVYKKLLPCSADRSATRWRQSRTPFPRHFLFVRLYLTFQTTTTHLFRKFSVP